MSRDGNVEDITMRVAPVDDSIVGPGSGGQIV
jgi:hypothetical protein